jgi:LPPG:FO 2-phospho-L-lactate transferase
VLEALEAADLVVYCPSNPWVSIDPILAVPGVRQAASRRAALAVSPLIGGKAVKGPAAKMFAELGIEPSALAVAAHYGAQERGGLLTGFVLDQVDAGLKNDITLLGLETLVVDTLMKSKADRVHLAEQVMLFGRKRC